MKISRKDDHKNPAKTDLIYIKKYDKKNDILTIIFKHT